MKTNKDLIDEIRFSAYNNIRDIKSTLSISIRDIIECIRSNKMIKAQIDDLRITYNQYLEEQDVEKKKELEDQYKEDKSMLPNFTISGVFSKRNSTSLVKHSHCMQIDIDYKDNTNFKDFEFLRNDKYTFVMFDSPNGRGKKLIAKVYNLIEPGDVFLNLKMNAIFEQMDAYYSTTYGLKIDPACKKISLPCYFSYDENLFLNIKAKPFKHELTDSYFENNYRFDSVNDVDDSEYEDVLMYLKDECEKQGVLIHSDIYEREVGLAFVICDLIADDETRLEYYLSFCKLSKRTVKKDTQTMMGVISKYEREKNTYIQYRYTINTLAFWARELGIRLPGNLYAKIKNNQIKK